MAHWFVERLEAFAGRSAATGLFEAESEEEAVRAAWGEEKPSGSTYYRVTGPLPESGTAMTAPGAEYEVNDDTPPRRI